MAPRPVIVGIPRRDAVAGAEEEPDAEAVWEPPAPVDARRTLASLRRGSGDPTHRTAPDGALWRTASTPVGPATYRITGVPTRWRLQAWGPAAAWVAAGLPELLGSRDDPAAFRPRHRALVDAHRASLAVRVPRTRLVWEALAASVLEQKVTGGEARASWRTLLRWHGPPAPGPAPAGMRVCPPPAVWARIPSWDWHRAGVDPKRARTVLAAASVAARLQEAVDLPLDDAARRLRSVPGVGVWTVAEVAQRALGDLDRVSVGDFHVAAHVGWVLLGRPVDDDEMLRLLEPYRGQRYRVQRLVETSGVRKPRFGPRFSPPDLRAV